MVDEISTPYQAIVVAIAMAMVVALTRVASSVSATAIETIASAIIFDVLLKEAFFSVSAIPWKTSIDHFTKALLLP